MAHQHARRQVPGSWATRLRWWTLGGVLACVVQVGVILLLKDSLMPRQWLSFPLRILSFPALYLTFEVLGGELGYRGDNQVALLPLACILTLAWWGLLGYACGRVYQALSLRRWGDRKNPASACRNCGYNLTGNMSGVCPECGKPTGEGTSLGLACGEMPAACGTAVLPILETTPAAKRRVHAAFLWIIRSRPRRWIIAGAVFMIVSVVFLTQGLLRGPPLFSGAGATPVDIGSVESPDKRFRALIQLSKGNGARSSSSAGSTGTTKRHTLQILDGGKTSFSVLDRQIRCPSTSVVSH